MNNMEEHWIFNPKESERHRDVDESKLIAYNEELQISQLQAPHWSTKNIEFDPLTAVIHIKGICKHVNLQPKVSWAVYFGPNSPYNSQGTTNEVDSMVAEFDALSHAVDTIRRITRMTNTIRHFTIATDSKYLYTAMTFWAGHGGINFAGKPVLYAGKFLPIHNELYFLNFASCADIKVKFWLVKPEKNQEADAIAREAGGIPKDL
ncbi:hypothetical protein NUW58_g8765 [Xylaria curta]|uniref:Uncharacterized protein n=1 Tax=Xylaria curta TaxID=42375 RepID=A0ACC1N4V1_9PEZI|nr:hypothetical protein NUW58_g8765 [Xylaria curta]